MWSRLLCLIFLVACCLVLPSWGVNDIYGSLDDPLVAMVLGTAVHTRSPQEMQFVVLGKLFDRYAAAQGIEVSPTEIDAYLERKGAFLEADRQKREMRRAELATQLQTGEVPREERERLEKELALHDSLADMESEECADDSAEMRAYEEQIARSFILKHKINQALYRQYGGRVIFQQAGPEPLDAYRAFLKEQAALGNFKIVDTAMEEAFWGYFRNDSIHDFYPPGSEEEAHAFDRMFSEGAAPVGNRP